MSRSSKRLKLQTKKSADPLEILHEDVHELLLQHLDPSDVIISSHSSPKWFKVIGNSKKCMKQISLGLDKWWNHETSAEMVKIMNMISKSSRKYQNVQINANDDENVSKASLQLLKKLAPNVVDLVFLNADNIQVNEHFKFPKLQKLKFINNVCDIDELLFQGSTVLKELHLKHHYWAEPEPAISCLEENKQLVMLKLWDTGISKVFKSYEPNMFQFKLKRFATGCEGIIDKETEENFLKFLDTQSNSLEAIRFRSGLDGVSGNVINKVFGMSAMNNVHLDGIGNLSALMLPKNERIIELRLPSNIDTLDKLKPFLIALPKLETLSLKKINKDILYHIALTMNKLKTLNYSHADCCISCFKRFIAINREANQDFVAVPMEWN